MAFLNAEELGVTQANVDDMRKTSKDPNVMRLVGTGEDMGVCWVSTRIGLTVSLSRSATTVNHGLSTLVRPHRLIFPRGMNKLWTDGGLMYAMPIR